MANETENENLQSTPKDELLRQIEAAGQVEEQAVEEQKPEEEVTKPVDADKAPSETTVEDKDKEAKAEPKADETLIAGKFKSQDDLVKAYQEIEKKATREAQLRSSYKDALGSSVDFDDDGNVLPVPATMGTTEPTPNPVQPQTSPQQQYPPRYEGTTQQDQVLGMLEQRYNALEQQVGPVKAQLIIQAEMAQAITSNALTPVDNLRADNSIESQKTKLRSADPMFSKFEGDVDKVLGRLDAKSKMNPAAVQSVYNMLLGQNYKKLLAQGETEAQAKAVEIEKQKQKAQVEHQTKTPEEPAIDLNSLDSAAFAKEAGLKTIDRY